MLAILTASRLLLAAIRPFAPRPGAGKNGFALPATARIQYIHAPAGLANPFFFSARPADSCFGPPGGKRADHVSCRAFRRADPKPDGDCPNFAAGDCPNFAESSEQNGTVPLRRCADRRQNGTVPFSASVFGSALRRFLDLGVRDCPRPGPAAGGGTDRHAMVSGPRADGRPRHRVGGRVESAGDHGDAADAAARVRPQGLSRSGLFRHGVADRPAADHFATVRRGHDDRPLGSSTGRQGAGNRHRQRLPGGRVVRRGPRCLYDRNPGAASTRGRGNTLADGLQERTRQVGRRFSRLARGCAVRQDHRHLFARKGPAAAGRSAARRGADGDPARRALSAGRST